ncbi:DUF1254 domain-containing protein [Planctomicrobium piriforme]|uniref:Uncharacterized conserved protein n=1 Tax=Planctomicrobium piriforme TaxID=1576369 RepID=A0A1I3PRI6_9PLAN|nr:DUF1254 domain-containing protein [Planctomicrobium piriforme]SFJ24093.1 Uncharacterized conserved protein [Planctomicrobium piriforme]
MNPYFPRFIACFFTLLSLNAKPTSAQAELKIPLAEVTQIAEEAFIYGYPLVMNYGTVYEYAVDKQGKNFKAPFNVLYNTARVYTPADTTIVTPNSDTPYSFVTADLRAEPLVLTLPAIEKDRYYSVQLIDLYTDNFGYMGSRTTGNGGGTYMVTGPNWKGTVPAGVAKVFPCETEFAILLIRTQLFGPADLENVKKIQAGYKAQPLSQYLGQPAPPQAATIDWPMIDKFQAAKDPFEYLAFILQFCPTTGAAAVEQPLRERFKQIGIAAGQPVAANKYTEVEKAAIGAGIRQGLAKIKESIVTFGKDENGWRVGSPFGDRAFFHGDWLKRAGSAMAGIYGNNAVEALYPILSLDSAGQHPNSGEHNYMLTFPAGQLPPCNAFWSVTMYDGKTQLLIENPIDRYLINSPMLPNLKKNTDGSITLYVQKDSPGKDHESNWLPAPNGLMYVVMRLYWPKEEALSGKWQPPAMVVGK